MLCLQATAAYPTAHSKAATHTMPSAKWHWHQCSQHDTELFLHEVVSRLNSMYGHSYQYTDLIAAGLKIFKRRYDEDDEGGRPAYVTNQLFMNWAHRGRCKMHAIAEDETVHGKWRGDMYERAACYIQKTEGWEGVGVVRDISPYIECVCNPTYLSNL